LALVAAVFFVPAELAAAYISEDSTDYGTLAFVVLSLVGYPWAYGAIVATISRPARSPLEPFGRTVDRLPTLVVANLVSLLAILIGLVLLIVPGLLIGARLSAATPAIVLDRHGPIAALERSNGLVRGHTWAVVGAFVVVALFVLALALAPLVVTLVAESPWAIGLGNALFAIAFNVPTAALAYAVYRKAQAV
jgi:hypothetical protein